MTNVSYGSLSGRILVCSASMARCLGVSLIDVSVASGAPVERQVEGDIGCAARRTRPTIRAACYPMRSPRAATVSAGVRWAYLLQAGAPIAHSGGQYSMCKGKPPAGEIARCVSQLTGARLDRMV